MKLLKSILQSRLVKLTAEMTILLFIAGVADNYLGIKVRDFMLYYLIISVIGLRMDLTGK